MRARPASNAGATLLELVVAAGLMVGVTAIVLQLLLGGRATFDLQPEMADMQQRLRVAIDLVSRDLRDAGSGLTGGASSESLWNLIPAVRPGRRGLRRPDDELAAFDDRLSIVHAPLGAAQARLASDIRSQLDAVPIDTARVGCVPGTACGFRPGMRVLLIDLGGVGRGYDIFTVTGRRGDALLHASPNPPLSRPYSRPEGWVTEVRQRTYYWDAATSRLMRYDGFRSDQPIVDHVAGFAVSYYVDPSPVSVPPPPPGMASCVYEAGDPPRPLLQDLGGEAPRPLTLAQLRDGPICGVPPNRFDGDLLRVRRVRLTLRIRVAAMRLRPAGEPSSPAGAVSTAGSPAVEDLSVSVDIAPRLGAGWLPSLAR